ncbi:hypothetical protein B7486_45720 [cyanobacterium TDX16]|nr:hypothetical protein B7486_45720 [cyanobacterium TDX16]
MDVPEPFPTGILNRLPGYPDYRVEVMAWLNGRGWQLEFPQQGVALHRCLYQKHPVIAGMDGVVMVRDGLVRVVNLCEVDGLRLGGWSEV